MSIESRRAGFEEFVLAREQRWLRTARALTGDWHAGQDLVQTVLLTVYVDWPRVERAGNPDGYVHRCLVNAFLDTRRRPWRRERLARSERPTHPEPVVADPSGRADDQADLVAALRRLPPGQRAVLVLRFLEDLDVQQTAGVLGCSTGTVKSQTARGLAALRTHLPVPHADRGEPS